MVFDGDTSTNLERARVASIVDDDIRASQQLLRLTHQRLHCLRVAHIARYT